MSTTPRPGTVDAHDHALGASPQDDVSGRDLAGLVIRQADHRGVGHVGVAEQDRLQLGRGHLERAF